MLKIILIIITILILIGGLLIWLIGPFNFYYGLKNGGCRKPCHANINDPEDLNCWTYQDNNPLKMVCTLEYRPEDECLRYAYCQKTEEGCQAIKEPEYYTCLDCYTACYDEEKELTKKKNQQVDYDIGDCFKNCQSFKSKIMSKIFKSY